MTLGGGKPSRRSATTTGEPLSPAAARVQSPWREDLRTVGAFGTLSTGYVLSFLLLYVSVRQLAPGEIVYYSSVATLLWAFVANLAVTLVVGPLRRLRLAVVVPALVTFLLAGYAFVITVPSLLDRSISHFVIGTLAEIEPAGADLDTIQQTFIERYVEGTAAVQKRLQEQIVSGNVVRDGERYRLTPRGQALHQTAVLLARLFNITDHYVSPLRRRG